MANKQNKQVYFRSMPLPPKMAEKNYQCAYFHSNTGCEVFVYQESETNPFVITVVKKGAQPSMKEVNAAVYEFAEPDAIMALILGPKHKLMPGQNETYFHIEKIGIAQKNITKQEDANSVSEKVESTIEQKTEELAEQKIEIDDVN